MLFRSRCIPGPRIRRECISLVDTALNEDPTVRRPDIEHELKKRGVTVPPFPARAELGLGDASQSEPIPAAAQKSEHAYREYLQKKEREQIDRFVESRLSGKYEAAMKAYDAKWAEIKKDTRYNEAWEAVFKEKRAKAITDCILNRTRREGVSVH